MNSIEKRFKKIQAKTQVLSTYSCFYRAIVGRKLTNRAITENFNGLVDKSDYSRSDKNAILQQLKFAGGK